MTIGKVRRTGGEERSKAVSAAGGRVGDLSVGAEGERHGPPEACVSSQLHVIEGNLDEVRGIVRRALQASERAGCTAPLGQAVPAEQETPAVASDALRRLCGAVTEMRAALRNVLRRQDELVLGVHLMASVAHDLNGLWAVAGSSAQFLVAGLPEGSGLREDAERIKQAVKRGAELGRALIAVGRQQPARLESVDARELLDELLPLFSALLGKDVELRVEVPPGAWRVRANRAQIGRVLMNLVANARDAVRVGGSRARAVAVTVSNADVARDWREDGRNGKRPKPGAYLSIAVSDTGCGMDSAVQRRVFRSGVTTKHDGSGIGLVSVANIVERHGGWVACTSQLGVGSTLRIFLPRAGGERRASRQYRPAAGHLA